MSRRHFEPVDVPAGERFFTEGEPAACFYVLVSGTIRLTKRVSGDDVEITRSGHPGSYCGATQSYLADVEPAYRNSGVADTDVSLLRVSAKSGARPCTSGSRCPCTCSKACSSGCATPSRPRP